MDVGQTSVGPGVEIDDELEEELELLEVEDVIDVEDSLVSSSLVLLLFLRDGVKLHPASRRLISGKISNPFFINAYFNKQKKKQGIKPAYF